MDLLKRLINLNGVSGNESEVRSFILKEAKRYQKDVFVDKMGNIVIHKKGIRPSILLAAHMDEVGLIARRIDSAGRIYIGEIGGLDASVLLGQRVYIQGKDKVKGVITCSQVVNNERIIKPLKVQDLFVETGYGLKDLSKRGIKIGSYVSFDQESTGFSYLSNDIITAKALDDRIGCYILLEVMRKMKTRNEVFFIFTVQEEVGLYGAKASVFNLQPDYAIAVDVTDHDDEEGTLLLGKGPVLTIKDAEMIGNKCLNDSLQKIAKKSKINLQLEVNDSGTTDASSIFAAKGGIPSSVLGISVKNLHTTVGIASVKDIENNVKVLCEFLRSPPRECWA